MVCVVAYAWDARAFAWANALCWPVIAADAFLAGAYGSTVLALSFGAVGAWKLWQARWPLPGPTVKLSEEYRHRILARELDEVGGPIHIRDDL